jgi:23S rRNA (guanosine2251-2'-O)-methyltransferase
MTGQTYVYGKNAFHELLRAKDAGGGVSMQRVYLTRFTEKDGSIISAIQSRRLTYSIVTDDEIDHMVGRGAVHQGVAVLIDGATLYADLATVLEEDTDKKRIFVVLDHLEDPHNVGAIIRSASAFGATAVIMAEHNQVPITGAVIKASSGTVFTIPVVKVSNINSTLLSLKEKGFWVYGLTGGGDSRLTETIFDEDTIIVVGSEGDGIAHKTLEHCDFKLSIPISERCESLNASNAVAVTLYEWRKQNP